MHVGQPRKEHFPGKVVHLCTGGDLGRLGRPGSLNPFPTDYDDAVLDGVPPFPSMMTARVNAIGHGN
jgi:hypothetical protein